MENTYLALTLCLHLVFFQAIVIPTERILFVLPIKCNIKVTASSLSAKNQKREKLEKLFRRKQVEVFQLNTLLILKVLNCILLCCC